MTVLEKEKYRLIRAIMDDTDEKRVLEVSKLYQDKPSFMCSAEELKASLPEVEKEIAEGKYISHEEMKKTRKVI